MVSAQPQFRFLRAGVFTSACVGVAMAGHAMMSARELPLLGPAVGFALVYVLAWAGADRERGLGAILCWMVWAQAALHTVFGYAQSAAFSAADPLTAHPAVRAAVPPAGADTAPATAMAPATDVGMFVAHLLCASIGAWWLRRGDAALFALLRLAATLLLPVLLVVGALPSHRYRGLAPLRPRRGDGNRVVRCLRHTVVLRGPPEPLPT
ncbi:hypothetical protein [Salinactinospora qingdaonensis]